VQISKLQIYEALIPDIGNKQFYLRDDILLRKGSVAWGKLFYRGDVLLRRRFVIGDVLLRRRCVYRRFVWRRFVEETFCQGDVLYVRHFCYLYF
jgi:hypothetical protein